MIYTLEIYKDNNSIFSHDIILDATQNFAEQIQSALNKFRLNNPNVGLFDDGVEIKLGKSPK